MKYTKRNFLSQDFKSGAFHDDNLVIFSHESMIEGGWLILILLVRIIELDFYFLKVYLYLKGDIRESGGYEAFVNYYLFMKG